MTGYSGLTLAYLGDAVLELLIRDQLIKQGFTKVDTLHQKAVEYTSAEGQARAFLVIKDILTEEELGIFKRGRNAKTDRKAKNASLSDYRQATGLEALFGALYLNNNHNRLEELLDIILSN